MNKYFGCLISIIFTVATTAHPAAATPFKSKIQVQITHTHEHGKHHHSHDLPEAPATQDKHDGDHPESHQDTHSHLLTLVSAVAVIIPAAVEIIHQPLGMDLQGSFFSKNPPKDRALDSIFRPPIQA